ncbi:MAG: nucleoside-diphosphate-sugar epimerase [Arcticibacterium sp.]|jgi:nucleoside-diphosphate-sugar epimerase
MQTIQENHPKKISVSILGCGWLGLPLAEFLIKKECKVLGSTTSIDKIEILKQKKIIPELINLNPEWPADVSNEYLYSEVLIICFPPKLRTHGEAFFLSQIKSLAQHLNQFDAKKIIFTSSTSVYPSLNKEMSESEADIAHVFFQAESLLIAKANELGKKINVLRLSGLMGYGRIPCKYFSGKKGLKNGDTPVNYIFRDDVIKIISRMIEGIVWNETLNITAPLHPTRNEVMAKCTEETIYEMPEYIQSEEKSTFKIINGAKFHQLVDYTFQYPNPLDFPFK